MSAAVAILLPVYNAEKFLRECLDSILNQTFTEFELFACNDGSTDDSPAILREYAARDARIRILENPRNMGIVATRNHLLQAFAADTPFVAWIDADDVMLPDRLQRQLEYLKTHPAIGAVGSSLEIIDENSAVVGFRSYPETPQDIRNAMMRKNVMAQSSMMLRGELIRYSGEYSAKYPVCEDYDYWLRALAQYDFANLHEPVIRYRISSTQSKQTRLKQTLRNTIAVQRACYRKNHWHIPPGNRLYFLAERMLLLLPAAWILKIFMLFTCSGKMQKERRP